jgi:AcrR family transcriptional regulator
MPKDTYIPCLLGLFRQYGYDGTTLAKISEATGLGKASLYHHFPGGKEEMVKVVMDYLEDWLEKNVLRMLRSPGKPLTRLELMCNRINEVYEEGQQPCLFAILLLGSARDVFHDQVRDILHGWIEAIASVLMESGIDVKLAHQRGEDGVIAIQGALILSQGFHDSAPFQRVLKQLPQQLCKGILA